MDAFVYDSRQPHGRAYWADLWRARELLLVLVRRDVAVRYRQTALGVLWVALQPLGLMLIFTLIFGRWVRLDTGAAPYHLFVLTGLLPWQFFAASLNAASGSVVGAQALVSKVYFPRLVIPLAAVGAPLVDALIALTLLLAFLLFSGVGLTPYALLVPFVMVLAMLIAIGLGCFVTALTVRYRDFHHLLPFVISTWMFLTPVIYPPSLVPEPWQWLVALNPLSGVVSAIRSALLGLPFEPKLLLSSVAWAVALCWLGARFFLRREARFADVI
jgi:lipopolysaccharide transport system permease protein